MAMNIFKFRVDDELRRRASERAASEDTNLSVLIRQWLENYVSTGQAGKYAKVRLTMAERIAVSEALGGLDIAGIVVDAVNKGR